MADLDVQPKSGRPWWIWLLLGLAALALLFFLMRGCDRHDDDTDTQTTTDTTRTTTTTTTTESTTDADGDGH